MGFAQRGRAKAAWYNLFEPLAKLQFCEFNGVDRLCRNVAGRDFGADSEMEGADFNCVLQLPHLNVATRIEGHLCPN